MKSGALFNCIQEIFSHGYGLVTGSDPYPLRSLVSQEYETLRPRKILDVGCGSGCYATSNFDYTGIDPNPRYIAYCRQNRPGRFEQMSAERLDLPDKTFDVVLCLSVGHHLADESLRNVLGEIDRVLDDSGLLIFADPIRPIVSSKIVAALLEWLDEGRWFRKEQNYVDLLGDQFLIEQKRKITDQFYQTIVLFCRKKPGHATS